MLVNPTPKVHSGHQFGVLDAMASSVNGPTFVEISWVKITEEDIARVVERSGIETERVRHYLESDEQDNNILRHFAYFRVYPRGKLFQGYTHTST